MIDLHMHSRYSEDGEFTPSELAEQCAAKGVRMMSVTDHNCAKANAEAKRAAKERGIDYVPGIEIDCMYGGTDFHLLGYGIDYGSNDFEAIEKNVDDQSLRASLERLAKTQELGFLFTGEAVLRKDRLPVDGSDHRCDPPEPRRCRACASRGVER